MIDKAMLPMLCGKSAQTVPFAPRNSMAEPKLDGWRGIVHVTEQGVKIYGGRNGSDYTGRVPYLEKDLAEIAPPGTVLDGEIVSLENWGEVQSIMSTHRPHRPTPSSPRLHFYLFDLLRVEGTDIRRMPWTQRRKLVEAVPEGELVRPTLLVPATLDSLETVLEAGFEGLVIKDPTSPYVNARSPFWTKVKPQQTADAVVVGFKPGKAGGAWDGKVGAFEIELLDSGVRTTIKCGTDARHLSATHHPERWMGRQIEIKHHGLSKDGVPRHPQFFRLRDDLVAA